MRSTRGMAGRTGRWAGRLLPAAVLAFVVIGGGAAASPSPGPTASVPVSSERGRYDPEWATSSDLDAFIGEEFAELRLAGLAVVVIAEGAVLFDGTYGEAEPDGAAVTSETPFVLGSTSKQFTALAVHQLVAQDRMDLDDDLATLLPDLGGTTSALADVTARQLLAHTSGLSRRAGLDFFSLWPQAGSLRDEARRVLRERPPVEPGIRFEYSNANYTLLGAILEEVTGETYESALQELVARPLGLEATTSDLERAGRDGLAVGAYTWFRLVNVPTPVAVTAAAAPSGYVTSTADDLTRLVEAHLGAGQGISEDVLEATRRPLTEIDEYIGYSSGWYDRAFWELTDLDEGWQDPDLPRIWEHDGDSLRSMSYVGFAPDLGFGLIVLTNTALGTEPARFTAFTDALIHEIVGTRATPWRTDPVVAAGSAIMIGLPLAQALTVAWLAVALRRPPRSAIARWLPVGAGVVLTVVALLIAFVVVPANTRADLIDSWWWSGAPDLAISVGLSLLLAACAVPLLAAQALAASRGRGRAVEAQ